MIHFNYSPFEEDIVITGKKGTGKTDRAKKILSEIRNIPYTVYDFQRDKFKNFGKPCYKLSEIDPLGQNVYIPRTNSLEEFKAFCNHIHFQIAEKFRNHVYCIDELHQFIPNKQSSIPELYTLVMSDRNKGISGIFISTVHTAIPNWILTNVQHVFAYRLMLEGHIDWLEKYVGIEAWLLFPQDKRKKLIDDQRVLNKHGFVYRNLDLDAPEVEIGEN